MDNQELHNEEILAVQKGIAEKLEGSIVVPVQKFPKQMEAKIINEVTAQIKGEVELSDVQFKNLGKDLESSVKLLVTEVVKAIQSQPKPVTEVSVKNLSEAKLDDVTVKNLTGLERLVKDLTKAVIDSQPIVNVEKQQVTFPKAARDAIPVRLSDGKSFINQFIAAASASGGETDPLVGYQPSDIDDSSTPKYYGFVKASGAWYIMRESSGAYRYIRGERTDSVGAIYSDAWTDRANLSYLYFYEVF